MKRILSNKPEYKIGCWAMGADLFMHDFFFTNQHDDVILFCKFKRVGSNQSYEKRFYADPNMFNFKHPPDVYTSHSGSPRIIFPLHEKKNIRYLYIFASPIYEYEVIYRQLLFMAQNYRSCSIALFKDFIHAYLSRIMQFITALKNTGSNLLVLEGNYRLDDGKLLECQKLHYKKYVDAYRKIMIDEIENLGIPVIRLPTGLSNAYGFTKEEYRRDQSLSHVNAEYAQTVSRHLLSFLEKNSLTFSGPQPTVAGFSLHQGEKRNITWVPENPLLRKTMPDYSQQGLLALLESRAQAYGDIVKRYEAEKEMRMMLQEILKKRNEALSPTSNKNKSEYSTC
ncbi:MAG: hypothetical protein LBB34_01195 [Holosporales bacterium]|nr:hypothetical protein [Holosporales bacterium]